MIFFSKESKSEKNVFFLRGEGKGGLASVSEFVLQRIQISKKKYCFLCIFFFIFFFLGGGGGCGGGLRGGGVKLAE